MTITDVVTILIFGTAALLAAAVLHAIVAAIDQIPYAAERELAARTRPDGRPTRASRLAADVDHTQNAASVAHATFEAVGLTLVAIAIAEMLSDLTWEVWAVVTFAAIGVAFVSLVLVRALPRQLAREYPETVFRSLAPIGWLLMASTAPVRAVVPALRTPALSEREDLVEQAQGALEDEDAQMLRSVVNLGDTLAREVMVPRTDMITIASGTSLRKALVLFQRSGFSRVPVIGEDFDDVVGVVYFKDTVKAGWDEPDELDSPVDSIMRDPVFLPESVPVDDLLRKMQDEVFHMAIVVDEFGGVAGLVTIEDALEEIVGELTDEHDREESTFAELPDGSFRVPARFSLDDLSELFELEIDDDDVETVAGLLAKSLGKVPIPGATASVQGLRITAERAEGRRRRLTTLVVSKERAKPAAQPKPSSRSKSKSKGEGQ
jgi:CBS domain containing-hemolysin-like protein